jgi:bifunctional non-homologous end joining protein LigD
MAARKKPQRKPRARSSAHKLETYRKKRDFARTREPSGAARPRAPGRKVKALSFVVQEHHARRLHYDFRLELDGVLLSWAVPKGPSMEPGVKRLAVQTEDHPLEYGSFEGEIPQGEYGGGTVKIWDKGVWAPLDDAHEALERGRMTFALYGEKLRGGFHLVRSNSTGASRARSNRTGEASRRKAPDNWLLIKSHDGQ